MPKQTFTLNDFSGGANGYVDPLDIADNELAICQGFKAEPGTVIVLGDMKGAYTPSAANGSDQIAIRKFVKKHGLLAILLKVGDIAVKVTKSTKDDEAWAKVKKVINELNA